MIYDDLKLRPHQQQCQIKPNLFASSKY